MPPRIHRLCLLIAAFILGVATCLIYERGMHPRQTAKTATMIPLATTSTPAGSPLSSSPPSLLHPSPAQHHSNQSTTARVNAAFVVLLQNKDLHDMRKTMRMLESTFNYRHHYPYVFLNDIPFTEHFKTHIQAMTKAPCYFGTLQLLPTSSGSQTVVAAKLTVPPPSRSDPHGALELSGFCQPDPGCNQP